jgi:hypothetical protein
MHCRSSKLAQGVIPVPKLSKCTFRSPNLLIVSRKVEVFELHRAYMWVQILFLKFSTQILYFIFFSKILFQNSMPNILFSNISSKIFPFYFLFFYKFDHMSFLFYNFLYRSFLFKYIYTSKLV